MAQTILDEYIAAWEEEGAQPDPAALGFENMEDMLRQAQDAMMELGEAASNANREYKILLTWAKTAHRWMKTYFSVPPKFMQDVPPAVIRDR